MSYGGKCIPELKIHVMRPEVHHVECIYNICIFTALSYITKPDPNLSDC
jgi:hypothetical protein